MKFDKSITRAQIANYVNEFAYSTFGNDFCFRPGVGEFPGQFDVCVDTIFNFVRNQKDDESRRTAVLQAPTGSGKSRIAMIIAGVLVKEFGMRGYILVSDRSLLDQYVNEVELKCPTWGAIKGKSAYMCVINGRKYDHGVCKIKNADTAEYTLESSCDCPLRHVCKYEVARRKAASAPVVVCTYYYWLIQKDLLHNYLSKIEDNDNDIIPEFVICDECHNISNIIQDLYSISVGEEYIKHTTNVLTAYPNMFNGTKYDRDITSLIAEIVNLCEKGEIDMESSLMTDYYEKMSKVCVAIKMLKNKVSEILKALKLIGVEKKSNGDLVYELDSKYYKELSWFRNAHEKLTMYIGCIEDRYDKIIATINQEKTRVILNSTDESFLLNEHMHAHYKFAMFMSATIGGFSHFVDELCIDKNEDIRYTEMGSTFDFSNSPIFYTSDYPMSRNTYDTNIPIIAKMVDNIMNVWTGKRGCIFTSSYKMVDDIIQLLSEGNAGRILSYKNSDEKMIAMIKFKSTPDAVLIGPSLFEGLSLDDDLCRFSIITKVPYADISNKLTNWKRLRYGQEEYNTSAIRDIIQAVGRGVRNEHDWCYTYILDGAFGRVYDRDRFPDDFKRRFRLVNSKVFL